MLVGLVDERAAHQDRQVSQRRLGLATVGDDQTPAGGVGTVDAVILRRGHARGGVAAAGVLLDELRHFGRAQVVVSVPPADVFVDGQRRSGVRFDRDGVTAEVERDVVVELGCDVVGAIEGAAAPEQLRVQHFDAAGQHQHGARAVFHPITSGAITPKIAVLAERIEGHERSDRALCARAVGVCCVAQSQRVSSGGDPPGSCCREPELLRDRGVAEQSDR